MTDGQGRTIDYLRISVTDRCNLRCIYCMPEEGVELIEHENILRLEEIVSLCQMLAEKGLKKIKLTGGEPLLRRGILGLIKDLKAIPGIENVTITTNGCRLREMYDDLVEAGIDAITVSLDTMDREIYHELTRSDTLPQVLDGLFYALKEQKVLVKINCVPILGFQKQKLEELVLLTREYPVSLRFIEMMPIGVGASMSSHGLREDELRHEVEAIAGTLTPVKKVLGNGPCRYYQAEGCPGTIGFISAVTHRFCSSCNRVRLTSEGFFKTCLQYDKGVDLKEILKRTKDFDGAKTELHHAIEHALLEKPRGHQFDAEQPIRTRAMSQIGG